MEVDERRPRSTGDLHLVCEDKPEIPITSVSLPASPNNLAPVIPPIIQQPPAIGKRKLASPTPPQDNKCLPQQFCLKWNNYQTNLTNVFDDLLQNESFVDVTLACDGQSIKAHKMVLSACSPYFQALLYDNPCQHPIVIMRDVKWPELKAVIEFMYKGEINIDREKIAPLLRVAEMLQIRGLAEVGGEVAAAQSSSSMKNEEDHQHATDGLENLSKKMRISESNLTVSVGGSGRRRRPRGSSHSPSIQNVHPEILTTTPLLPLHSHYDDDDDDEDEDDIIRMKEKQVEQQPQQLSKISVRNLNPSPISGGPLSSPTKSASLKPPPPAASSSTPSTPMAQQASTTAGVTTTPFNLAVTPPEVINLGMGGNSVSSAGGNGGSGEDFMRGGRGMSHVDDMEIKPEIAEMIREEERVSFYVYTNFFLCFV